MPRGDGTGPMCNESGNWRGLGLCADGNAARRGVDSERGLGLGFARRQGHGHGCGRGLGRGFAFDQDSPKTQKESLYEQKAMLQKRLEVIEKRLKDL
ncbi:MAG: DUF5320 domain-containing protein [Bacillota bacterium]